jgi:hypothetical protein
MFFGLIFFIFTIYLFLLRQGALAGQKRKNWTLGVTVHHLSTATCALNQKPQRCATPYASELFFTSPK